MYVYIYMYTDTCMYASIYEIYLCMCSINIHMPAYIHTICIIYTHIYIHAYTYTQVCQPIYMPKYIYSYINACNMCIYVHIPTYTTMHVWLWTCLHTYINMNGNMHICNVYTCTYIHVSLHMNIYA